MSWLGDAAGYGKKLLFLSERVEKNAEDLKNLRQDLNKLQNNANKIANAVRFNRGKIGDFKEWVATKDEAMYWKLKAELSEFEKKMNASNLIQAKSNDLNGLGSPPVLNPSNNHSNVEQE
mgnify:CR=1 FL=1